jgi:hypothetical protein
MPKSGLVRAARRRQVPRPTVEMPGHVLGQVEEMCHEVAVQLKRMRQLQDQADELRTGIRQWVGQLRSTTNQSIVEDDAEQ